MDTHDEQAAGTMGRLNHAQRAQPSVHRMGCGFGPREAASES